jgi:hypothetical protein
MWPIIMSSSLDDLATNLKGHSPVTLLCISAAIGIILSCTIRWLIATHRDRAFASKHGCKPAGSVMPKATDFWLAIKAIANRNYLEVSAPEVFTIDPENMKTILSTDFEKWELGDRRKLMLQDLIQNSIFVVDGKAWEHSRVSDNTAATYDSPNTWRLEPNTIKQSRPSFAPRSKK